MPLNESKEVKQLRQITESVGSRRKGGKVGEVTFAEAGESAFTDALNSVRVGLENFDTIPNALLLNFLRSAADIPTVSRREPSFTVGESRFSVENMDVRGVFVTTRTGNESAAAFVYYKPGSQDPEKIETYQFNRETIEAYAPPRLDSSGAVLMEAHPVQRERVVRVVWRLEEGLYVRRALHVFDLRRNSVTAEEIASLFRWVDPTSKELAPQPDPQHEDYGTYEVINLRVVDGVIEGVTPVYPNRPDAKVYTSNDIPQPSPLVGEAIAIATKPQDAR